MLNNNKLFIIILLLSIVVIMTLSLFKEGIFFGDNIKVSRCSGLGVTVMIIIAMFCMIISVSAFKFNIKEERDRLETKYLFMNDSEMNVKSIEDDKTMSTTISTSISQEFNRKTSETFIEDEIQTNNIVNENLQNTFLMTTSKIETEIETQINFQKVNLYKLGSVSFLAGIGAGLLGIGGGMIINPFLIIMNYSPMDAMAISSMGVLFTSTISTSEFLIMGAIKFSDLNYFLIFAGIGSLSGVFIIKSLIDRFQRQSILLMIILGIFIFAVIVLPLFGFLSIPVVNYFKFGSVCLE